MSTLCLSCGLCCDGTIFDVVPLTERERVVVTRLGLPIIERASGPAMPQPCEALDGLACQVYASRPAPCRAFHCALYDAVGADEVDLSEALAVIREAHGRLAELARRIGDAPEREPYRPPIPGAEPDEHEGLAAGPIQGARRLQKRRFDPAIDQALAAVERHLDLHFRGRARR